MQKGGKQVTPARCNRGTFFYKFFDQNIEAFRLGGYSTWAGGCPDRYRDLLYNSGSVV